jgi:hypothetical protein
MMATRIIKIDVRDHNHFAEVISRLVDAGLDFIAYVDGSEWWIEIQ